MSVKWHIQLVHKQKVPSWGLTLCTRARDERCNFENEEGGDSSPQPDQLYAIHWKLPWTACISDLGRNSTSTNKPENVKFDWEPELDRWKRPSNQFLRAEHHQDSLIKPTRTVSARVDPISASVIPVVPLHRQNQPTVLGVLGGTKDGLHAMSEALIAEYVKFNGSDIWGKDLGGTVWLSSKSPVPTLSPVSRSYMEARMCLNVTGTKLLPVLSCREANAGKEKLAGVLENPYDTASAQAPVALTKGVLLLKEKLGTRGRHNASTSTILPQCQAIRNRKVKQSKIDIRSAETEKRPGKNLPCTEGTAHPSLSPIPLLPFLFSWLSDFFSLGGLCHTM